VIAECPDPIVLPAGLRERVLQASQTARAAGTSVPDVPEISASEAFSRSVDAFYGVLCALSEDDWQRPVLRELTVQGLVGHLIGVEYDVHRALSGDVTVADIEHVESTQAEADRQAGRVPEATRSQWRAAVERTIELVARFDPDSEVAIHRLQLSVGPLLLVRAFELWTHENDIRSATVLPPSVPDPPTLQLMTNLAARALPVGADRIGLTTPARVRLVLTGIGGGTWDVTLNNAPSDGPPVRIIANTVDFCRLVANRAVPSELDLHISGDLDQATDILAAFSALALD
jgi:uncharacterized protein (TIGR03083 family)